LPGTCPLRPKQHGRSRGGPPRAIDLPDSTPREPPRVAPDREAPVGCPFRRMQPGSGDRPRQLGRADRREGFVPVTHLNPEGLPAIDKPGGGLFLLGPAIKVHVPLWITGSGHPNMAAIETHAPLGMSPADGRHPGGARTLTATACAYRRALQSKRFREGMLKSSHRFLATLMRNR